MAFPTDHAFKRMKKVEVINYVKHIHYCLNEDLHVALAERDQADMAFTELQNNTKSFEEVCSHGLAISKENEKLKEELKDGIKHTEQLIEKNKKLKEALSKVKEELSKVKEEYYQLDLVNQNLETKYLNGQWTKDLENKLGEKCELISQMKQLLSLS